MCTWKKKRYDLKKNKMNSTVLSRWEPFHPGMEGEVEDDGGRVGARGGGTKSTVSKHAPRTDKNNNGKQMRKGPPGENKSPGFQTSHKTSLISDKPPSREPRRNTLRLITLA